MCLGLCARVSLWAPLTFGMLLPLTPQQESSITAIADKIWGVMVEETAAVKPTQRHNRKTHCPRACESQGQAFPPKSSGREWERCDTKEWHLILKLPWCLLIYLVTFRVFESDVERRHVKRVVGGSDSTRQRCRVVYGHNKDRLYLRNNLRQPLLLMTIFMLKKPIFNYVSMLHDSLCVIMFVWMLSTRVTNTPLLRMNTKYCCGNKAIAFLTLAHCSSWFSRFNCDILPCIYIPYSSKRLTSLIIFPDFIIAKIQRAALEPDRWCYKGEKYVDW